MSLFLAISGNETGIGNEAHFTTKIIIPLLVIIMLWVTAGITIQHVKTRCREENDENKKGVRGFSISSFILSILYIYPFVDNIGSNNDNKFFIISTIIMLFYLLVQNSIMTHLIYNSEDCKKDEKDPDEGIKFAMIFSFIFVGLSLIYISYYDGKYLL